MEPCSSKLIGWIIVFEGCEMSKLRMAVVAGVVLVLQAGPAFAQACPPTGCTGGVPGPELGAGAAGLAAAIGMYRLLRQRTRP